MRRDACFYHPLGEVTSSSSVGPLGVQLHSSIMYLVHARPKHGQVPLMAELPSPQDIRLQREGASAMEKVRVERLLWTTPHPYFRKLAMSVCVSVSLFPLFLTLRYTHL